MTHRKGPQTSGQAHPTTTPDEERPHLRKPPVPMALADVALIDASTAAAAGSMSLSWWHEAVAAGRAPVPVIRAPRCTRWRLTDVAAFWRDFGNKADDGVADAMRAQATKASAAARCKRCTAAGATAQVGA